jgi:hypothetical protein
MRRLFTIILCLTFISAYSQYYEVGTFVGLSNYSGDLNEGSPMIPQEYNPAIGMFARYNFSRNFSMKAGLTKGQISGSDKNADLEELSMRNLSFRSDIIEVATTFEFNLLPFAIREKKKSAPYLFLGVGGFYFNPQGQMRGNWYDLQPLGTEGQGYSSLGNTPRYSRYQVSFPMGIGFKFNLNNKVNFGLEFGARKTFTDYLDDVGGMYPDLDMLRAENPIAASLSYRTPEVSTIPMTNPEGNMRGNPGNQDWFFFMGMTISVNMTDKYGLDFDEKYDVFKTDFTPVVKDEPSKKKRRKR